MSISRRSFCRGRHRLLCLRTGRFSARALARNPIAGINGKTTLTPSLCEMCSFRCPIQAQVVNNKTVFIGAILLRRSRGRAYAPGRSGVSWLMTRNGL